VVPRIRNNNIVAVTRGVYTVYRILVNILIKVEPSAEVRDGSEGKERKKEKKEKGHF